MQYPSYIKRQQINKTLQIWEINNTYYTKGKKCYKYFENFRVQLILKK